MKVRIGYGLGVRASSDPERFAALVDGLERHALRLALAVGAGHRRLPRPDRRPGDGGGPHHEAEVRVLRARAPGPQPDAAGQGAGHPRPPVRRAAAPGLRARRGRPRRAPGLRRSSGASGRRASTRRCRSCAGSGPARPSTTRARSTATRARWCGRSPTRSRSRSGSAASRRRSCAAAGASATAGCRRSAPPTTCAAASRSSSGTAAEHDRKIDPEHFGALIPYCDGEIPERRARRASRPAAPTWTRPGRRLAASPGSRR